MSLVEVGAGLASQQVVVIVGSEHVNLTRDQAVALIGRLTDAVEQLDVASTLQVDTPNADMTNE